MRQLVFRGAMLLCIPSASLRPAPADQPSRPHTNVVFFLADDLGWADVGCYGSPLHETPNVDRLAKQGVRFTNAYAPACSCSPSRAGIMTGKYPAHLGMTAIVEKHKGDRAPDDAPLLPATTKPFLPHEEVTVAEALKTRGYATCLVGKWHLGSGEYGPKGHGFDVAVAPPHRGAPKSYFWPQWDGSPNMKGRFEGEYLTDRLADEACRFVEEHRQEPFFLYLSFHSVHVPIEAKQDKVKKYEALIDEKGGDGLEHRNPHYAAMVESMDDAVGEVVRTLERWDLDGNTMILFFSDNGGLVHRSHVGEHTPATSNRPLRSGKGFLYEGGIREPLIVKWPGVAEPDSICNVPVHGCDLFPTICEAAGVAMEDLPIPDFIDGRSLRPLLAAPHRATRRRPLFWHYPHFSTMGGRPSGAVRLEKWKLLEHFETNGLALYDLKEDVGETTDLSSAYPEKVEDLHRTLIRWRKQVKALLPDRPNPNYRGS
ncbi:MAG: sulfatase [Planctomycetota bacterium]|jgi:arylsulfatase A-like enzyme